MVNECSLEKNATLNPSNKDDGITMIVLPTTLQTCPKVALITLISRMLQFFIKINDSTKTETKLTRFHSSAPPAISIYNYLIRLTKYSSLEPCVLITSVYYVDLLTSAYPDFTLNSLTVHRFLLTATSVASKGLCDSFFTNSHYAKVGGVQCSELNILENTFLQRVRYRIIPRDNNIKLCKYEAQCDQFILAPESKDVSSLRLSVDQQSAGFNVLDTYYEKITQLVGRFNPNAENFRRVTYVLNSMSCENNENIRKTQKRSFQTVNRSHELPSQNNRTTVNASQNYARLNDTNNSNVTFNNDDQVNSSSEESHQISRKQPRAE